MQTTTAAAPPTTLAPTTVTPTTVAATTIAVTTVDPCKGMSCDDLLYCPVS